MLYITVSGDYFDSISYQIYGSERFAPVLMRENAAVSSTVKFDAGVTLNVPAVSSQQKINTVPWGNPIVK